MPQHRGREQLHVVRNDVVAPFEQRRRARAALNNATPARGLAPSVSDAASRVPRTIAVMYPVMRGSTRIRSTAARNASRPAALVTG
jgi:hypothetical protein